MVEVKSFVEKTSSRFIGPNCPGVLTPGAAKVGIMPGFIAKEGRVGSFLNRDVDLRSRRSACT